jgi:hypothetical protein
MFCTQCGHKLPDDARFCSGCGARLATEEAPAAPQAPALIPALPVAEEPGATGPPADAPGRLPITTDAAPGPNAVSFTGLSGALDVLDGLVELPEEAQLRGIDTGTAHLLHGKLRGGFDLLSRRHGTDSHVGRAVSVLRAAGQALAQREKPTHLRAAADPRTWVCEVDLTGPEAELYNLCAREAQARAGLELRTLRTCVSCRQQRIINPEYEKMVQQRKQMDNLTALQRNVLSALARMRRDPSFICGRCQGMQASDRTVVLCPRCGTPYLGVMLGVCGKCGWNLATGAAGPPPTPAEPPPAASPPPAPQPPQADAKVLTGRCVGCGNTIRVPLEKIPEQGLRGKCGKCGRPLTIRRPSGG